MADLFVLTVNHPDGTSETRTFSRPLAVLGRDEGDIRITSDNLASGKHAEVRWDNGRLVVRDLGSRNGTWFNATRKDQPFEVRAGDRFQCAQTLFTVVSVEAPQVGAQPQPFGAPMGGSPMPMQQYGQYGQQMMAPEIRMTNEVTGGQMFVKLLVGYFLTLITLGIYGPWFLAGMVRVIVEKSKLKTDRGDVSLEFTGTGGALFVKMFVGYLLTIITLGIYGAWFMCNLLRYFAENMKATTPDGKRYQLRFDGTGGAMFGQLIVGYLLTAITFYIYLPWFICRIRRFIFANTSILEEGQRVGGLEFVGTGGDLFGKFIVGFILCYFTGWIYKPWWDVSLKQFYAQNTRIHIGDATYGSDFVGSGGDLFVLRLVNGLLMIVTLGIYTPWALAKSIRFDIEKRTFRQLPRAAHQLAA